MMCSRIGDYVLGDLLGAGGMGKVFAAEHPDHSTVVVKLLHDSLANDPVLSGRLRDEARTAQLVTHRNVVRVVDHGATPEGIPFLVMERAKGLPLGSLIQRDGPLPLPRVRTIASQILRGLAAIHAAGLVHGDMKSDNVLVDDADQATIIDFGLARRQSTHPDWLGEHVLSGTPEYMAPELVRGDAITPAADLYAVGVIIYEMLTGTMPFGGGTITAIFEQHVSDEVVSPALRCPERTIPAALERVIMRALAKDAQQRPHDAGLFAAAIERAITATCDDSGTWSRTHTSSSGPTREWTRKETSRRLPRPRHRFAVGTVPRDSDEIQRLRAELGTAYGAGDPDHVILSYLGLVQALVDEHRLMAAARELEVALAWLAEYRQPTPHRWRLLTTLAAIYDGIGDRERARATASDAVAAADETANELASSQAKTLLARLSAAVSRVSKVRVR